MTKLGIIGAMQEEVETLLALMENKKNLTKAGSVFHEGVLEGQGPLLRPHGLPYRLLSAAGR